MAGSERDLAGIPLKSHSLLKSPHVRKLHNQCGVLPEDILLGNPPVAEIRIGKGPRDLQIRRVHGDFVDPSVALLRIHRTGNLQSAGKKVGPFGELLDLALVVLDPFEIGHDYDRTGDDLLSSPHLDNFSLRLQSGHVSFLDQGSNHLERNQEDKQEYADQNHLHHGTPVSILLNRTLEFLHLILLGVCIHSQDYPGAEAPSRRKLGNFMNNYGGIVAAAGLEGRSLL
ncbi:hypothetical protein ES708_32356 [subsurface metagenome]